MHLNVLDDIFLRRTPRLRHAAQGTRDLQSVKIAAPGCARGVVSCYPDLLLLGSLYPGHRQVPLPIPLLHIQILSRFDIHLQGGDSALSPDSAAFTPSADALSPDSDPRAGSEGSLQRMQEQ